MNFAQYSYFAYDSTSGREKRLRGSVFRERARDVFKLVVTRTIRNQVNPNVILQISKYPHNVLSLNATMGSYSQLYIGDLYLSWKYDVPAYLTFMFEKKDYYCVVADDEDYIDNIGFKTNVKQSLSVLDNHGYDLRFFSQVYQSFYPDLRRSFLDVAKDQIAEDSDSELSEKEIDKLLDAHLSQFPEIGRLKELEDFVAFIRALMCSSPKNQASGKMQVTKLADGRKYQVHSEEYLKRHTYKSLHFVDFEELQSYMHGKSLQYPPWISFVSQLFEESYFYEYPEIVFLIFLRCALEAVDPKSEIRLELSDIVDNEEEVRDLHVQSASRLVEKVNLYNKVFQPLFQNEEDIRNQYVRSQCRSLLDSCATADQYKKGPMLEDLMELLFGDNGALEVIDKRVNTGDEEIDLVIKNTINEPFWAAFSSPLLFVECKNWSTSVGPKEIRDFEIKMQNHAKLAKLGFFVSYNGFTPGAKTELKRAGREDYHIVLIDKHALEEFMKSGKIFYKWLENKIAVLH